MDLKDLLLQFAGENEESLKLGELILSGIIGISTQNNFNNGTELYIDENCDIDQTVKEIDILLIESGYDSYEISKIDNNIIRVELF